MRRLIDEADRYIESLYENLKTSDLVNYGIAMNGIKSLLYSVGAKGAGDIAAQLEREAVEENLRYCQEKNNAFCDNLKWLIQRIVLTLPLEMRTEMKTEDNQRLAGLIQDLTFGLSKSDNDGILKSIEALKNYSYNPKVKAIIRDAEASEYAKAEEACKEILQALLNK